MSARKRPRSGNQPQHLRSGIFRAAADDLIVQRRRVLLHALRPPGNPAADRLACGPDDRAVFGETATARRRSAAYASRSTPLN